MQYNIYIELSYTIDSKTPKPDIILINLALLTVEISIKTKQTNLNTIYSNEFGLDSYDNEFKNQTK
jgi:hypothetical protein